MAGKCASCWNKSPPALCPPLISVFQLATSTPQPLLYFPRTHALSPTCISHTLKCPPQPSLTHAAPLSHRPQLALCLCLCLLPRPSCFGFKPCFSPCHFGNRWGLSMTRSSSLQCSFKSAVSEEYGRAAIRP